MIAKKFIMSNTSMKNYKIYIIIYLTFVLAMQSCASQKGSDEIHSTYVIDNLSLEKVLEDIHQIDLFKNEPNKFTYAIQLSGKNVMVNVFDNDFAKFYCNNKYIGYQYTKNGLYVFWGKEVESMLKLRHGVVKRKLFYKDTKSVRDTLPLDMTHRRFYFLSYEINDNLNINRIDFNTYILPESFLKENFKL